MSPEGRLLGETAFECEIFPQVAQVLEEFCRQNFSSFLKRREAAFRLLLKLIDAAPEESFLLDAVADFLHRLRAQEIIPQCTLVDFEYWLNQQSALSDEENDRVRAKITGKFLPRDDYQLYFPIGMGRYYPGSHYVTAHSSPDLDTTVASFWGWVDAFGARVCKGVHWWNLPGEDPPRQASRLFEQILGPDFLSVVRRAEGNLSVTALDFTRRQGLEEHRGDVLTSTLDHGRDDKLIIVVDDEGYYQGCWRTSDVERFRLTTLLLRNLWRWFESRIHVGLLQLLGIPELKRSAVERFIEMTLAHPLNQTEVLQEASAQHEGILESALHHEFGLEQSLTESFGSLLTALRKKGLVEFDVLYSSLQELSGELFQAEGCLTADRGLLFGVLAKLQGHWDAALHAFRRYCDQLSVAVNLKRHVFGEEPQYISPNTALEDVRRLMGPYRFMPVAIPTAEGAIPLGVVCASDLQRKTLGTTSLRDFCNREEVRIPSHIEVISVVDHHRCFLQTASVPTVLTGDVQSCNVLLAEAAFLLNDRYSLGGLEEEILQQERVTGDPRQLQRLFTRRVAQATRGSYFIHPRREFAEYLSFLQAILDDTDLLTRVSARDVICVAHLLNRMKSLASGHEVECINLDDIPRGINFAKRAARRILENPDMYSLYRHIYAHREQEVERDLLSCIEGLPSEIFADTKEQKGCARVGQTKIFPKNFAAFVQHGSQFRRRWLQNAMEAHRDRPQLELHIQMITTIAGADEVYSGNTSGYVHSDELWLWVPTTTNAMERLGTYLNGFGSAPEMTNLKVQVHLVGPQVTNLRGLFTQHFSQVEVHEVEDQELTAPIAIIRFEPAIITSRKLNITPHIPSIESL